jgi:hypothetical protein
MESSSSSSSSSSSDTVDMDESKDELHRATGVKRSKSEAEVEDKVEEKVDDTAKESRSSIGRNVDGFDPEEWCQIRDFNTVLTEADKKHASLARMHLPLDGTHHWFQGAITDKTVTVEWWKFGVEGRSKVVDEHASHEAALKSIRNELTRKMIGHKLWEVTQSYGDDILVGSHAEPLSIEA